MSKLVDDAVKLRRQMLEAAELILRAEAEGAVLTGEEISVLEAANIDSKRHESELNRIKRVLRIESEAGTKQQREKLAADIEAAKKARDAKLPKLRAELEQVVARLEGEIEQLNQAVEVPEQKLEKMQAATEQLRQDSILPKHIADQANHQRGRVKEQYAEVTQAESRIASLKGRIALMLRADESSRQFQDIVNAEKLYNQQQGYAVLNRDKLAAYIESMKQELAEAEAIVADGTPEFRKALEEAELVRDYYIK